MTRLIRPSQGLSTLTNLKILSIQANRLASISGLASLTSLEELHISHNALTSLSGLSSNIALRVIDISSNPISSLAGLETLTNLEEFWASYCKLDNFQEVEAQLKDKEKLETVYFEGNPLQLRQPALYRNKVRLALPQVRQIDASEWAPILFSILLNELGRDRFANGFGSVCEAVIAPECGELLSRMCLMIGMRNGFRGLGMVHYKAFNHAFLTCGMRMLCAYNGYFSKGTEFTPCMYVHNEDTILLFRMPSRTVVFLIVKIGFATPLEFVPMTIFRRTENVIEQCLFPLKHFFCSTRSGRVNVYSKRTRRQLADGHLHWRECNRFLVGECVE